MNYFEFYQITPSFMIDAVALRRTFYSNSKKYHPDFYTLESEEKQAEILELSTLNNKAYQTLSDFDKRMKYLLDLKGILAEEGKNKIPQTFLMEMMDINEVLMELEFDFDANAYQKTLKDIENQEHEIFEDVKDLIENYEEGATPKPDLNTIKDYYLKKRYLLRLRENLKKFQT